MKNFLCLACLLFLTTPLLAADLYQAKKAEEVYANPTKQSRVIYRLQPGEEFKVVGEVKGGWLRVRFSNQTLGYVRKGKVTSLFNQPTGIAEDRDRTNAPTLLPLGRWARWKGLAVRVERYELPQKCRGRTSGGPADGAKLVYFWLSVRNESTEAIERPTFYLHLSGVEKNADWFGGKVCKYDNESFGNDCSRAGRGSRNLYPGVTCGGWELFEVKQGLRVPEQFVTVTAHRSRSTDTVGQWRLGDVK